METKLKRYLIVNADDCNLTHGISEAILECFDRGIVSSTTWLVNFKPDPDLVRKFLRRKKLGIGIHLNLTLSRPVTPPSKIPSLIDSDLQFKARSEFLAHLPEPREIEREYLNQIWRFEKIFGRLPTHCDTHHQLHDHPIVFKVLIGLAKRFCFPIRRSRLMKQGFSKDTYRTTDHFWGDYRATHHWNKERLLHGLEHLAPGVNEIMSHPGKNDRMLQSLSSFTGGRQKEYELFKSSVLKQVLKCHKIHLIHFGEIPR